MSGYPAPILAWLLVAVPLGGGALLAVSGRRGNRAAPVVGVLLSTGTLGLACAAAATRPVADAPLVAGIRAGLAVDGLSALLVLTVAAVTLAVLTYAAGEFDRQEARARFFGLMLVFAGAMLVTVTATSLALLLMGWEVMGATSWALIGFWWREPRRVQAAGVAFLVTRAGDLGLYLAAGAAVAGGVGTLALADLGQVRSPWLGVVTVGVLLAAFGKSAQLPFSFWLSRAMEGPSPVSALLHSATMVAAGGYLLLRLHPLLAASGWGAPAAAWVGALTALALGLVAVAQRDLKQLLAASTCAQIGFMVLAAGAGGTVGGSMQLVAHAAAKSLLFLAAGAWLAALGTKQLPALRGAARRYPLVGSTFAIGAIALAGLPPASLWATKDQLLAAALARDPALYAVALAAAAVSAVYSAKAVWYVWQPLPTPPPTGAGYHTERPGTRRVYPLMNLPLVALAVPAATLGVLALPPVATALADLLDARGEPVPRAWELVLSGALALLAAAGTWRWGDRPVPLPAAVPAVFAQWLHLERLTQVVVVGPTLALARALAAFDDRVLDRGVELAATGGRSTANLAGRFGELSVEGAVRSVSGSALRLGALARRPQTGQLHQYYAQAVAGLAVLALVLVLFG